MKKLILFAAGMIAISCSENKKNTSNESPFIAGGKYEQEMTKEISEFKSELEREQKELEDKFTDISFDEYEHSFGTIKVGSKNKHYFVFKNTGKKPLVIESVKASCGCTTPQKPEKPIAPGMKDSILVEFSPYEGTSGQVEKTVTVVSNTFKATNQLFIKAVVE